MNVDKLGATPVAIGTVSTLVVSAALALAIGLRPPTAKADGVDTQGEVAVTQPSALTGTETPAARVILALVGDKATWGTKLPGPFGCATIPGAISATNGAGLTVHAYPAGQATPALEAIRCGTRTTVNGAPALRMSATGGSILAWTRGDIIVALSAASIDTATVNDLDARLVALLAEAACSNLAPNAADSTRNPVNSNYTAYTTTTTVSIDPLAQAQESAPPVAEPLIDLTIPTMPTGIAGPPLPAAVARPVEPTAPGPEPVTTTIETAAVDTVGPGCGWAFTGQSAPLVDEARLSADKKAAQESARLDLVTRQQQWAADTTKYRSDLAAYVTEAAAWNVYAKAAADVITHWTSQEALLKAYDTAVAEHEASIDARATFLSDQAAARAKYDSDLAACAATNPAAPPAPSPSSTVTPAPSPTATSSPDPAPCQPVRPAILDRTPPMVTPVPTPPVLWTPING